MQERDRTDSVRAAVAGVTHHIDAKRWDALRALFADDVLADYTSLFGGAAARQPSDALIGGWRAALARVRTQHLLGPITVALHGETATAECHVRALHQVPGAPSGELWEVLGHYVFELGDTPAGWKITAMKLEALIQTGNSKLLAEAASP